MAEECIPVPLGRYFHPPTQFIASACSNVPCEIQTSCGSSSSACQCTKGMLFHTNVIALAEIAKGLKLAPQSVGGDPMSATQTIENGGVFAHYTDGAGGGGRCVDVGLGGGEWWVEA